MITHVCEMPLYLKLAFHSVETNGKIHADSFYIIIFLEWP